MRPPDQANGRFGSGSITYAAITPIRKYSPACCAGPETGGSAANISVSAMGTMARHQ
jgi:hypothetical protein